MSESKMVRGVVRIVTEILGPQGYSISVEMMRRHKAIVATKGGERFRNLAPIASNRKDGDYMNYARQWAHRVLNGTAQRC